jgi:hypothetical protein
MFKINYILLCCILESVLNKGCAILLSFPFLTSILSFSPLQGIMRGAYTSRSQRHRQVKLLLPLPLCIFQLEAKLDTTALIRNFSSPTEQIKLQKCHANTGFPKLLQHHTPYPPIRTDQRNVQQQCK